MSTTTAATAAAADEHTPAMIHRAEQAAWEAPDLRPTFVPDGVRDTNWFTACPPWCDGENAGHANAMALIGKRQHRSTPLRVRQDAACGYRDDESDGVVLGHLKLQLLMDQRSTVPQILMIEVSGSGAGDPRSKMLSPMYPDEVRELISVLQHLLKVGMES